jgi:serine/threonine-protein kinase
VLGVAGLVPPGIERVVQRCLSKGPEQRPSHARELAEQYAEALAGQSQAVAPPRSPRVKQARNQPAPAPVPAPSVAAPAATVAAPAPEPTVVKPPAPQAQPFFTDPLAVVHHLEAWMPEKIATYKLRGFIHDVGGELLESVPGRITVRLGGKGCVYSAPTRGLSWLGIGRRSIDMELRLQRGEAGRDNQLRITVLFRSPGADLNADTAWRSLCTRIYCDLRGYLMGQNGAITDGVV